MKRKLRTKTRTRPRRPRPMRPDNAAPIIAAARHRHELTRARAVQALRELDHTGAPVTFAAVAAFAGVSRSWLYAQPDIHDEIVRLREATTLAGRADPRRPAHHRCLPAAPPGGRPHRTPPAPGGKHPAPPGDRASRRQVARALGEQRQASGGNPSYEPPF